MSNPRLSKSQTVSELDVLGLGADSRVLIVGLGKTGLSVARFLRNHGICFAVVDSRDCPPGLEELSESYPEAAVFLGGFNEAAFAAATHLVVNPGVPLETPPVASAIARGIRVFGDTDLFACSAQAPVVAITGSNGKSTVTTLVGQMAKLAGRRVRVGGNLGVPMLDLLDPEAELYVLELSSFQLERESLLQPAAAAILNVTPDHLDRYADLEAYARAKERIFLGQGIMVLNRDDPIVAAMARGNRCCLWFGIDGDPPVDFGIVTVGNEEWLAHHGEPLLRASELRLWGRHNLSNVLAALALGSAVGLSQSAMIRAIRGFSGLDHRMEWVAEIQGVTYINDSKATNVGACLAGLSGLPAKAVLIAGGDGKGADFSALRGVASEKLRAVILMGRDAPILESVFAGVVPVARAANMCEAVAAARRLAVPGDTVLLAPACASWDQYKDYQERGRAFVDAVRSTSS